MHDLSAQETVPNSDQFDRSVETWRNSTQSGGVVYGEGNFREMKESWKKNDWRLCAPQDLRPPPECEQLFLEVRALFAPGKRSTNLNLMVSSFNFPASSSNGRHPHTRMKAITPSAHMSTPAPIRGLHRTVIHAKFESLLVFSPCFFCMVSLVLLIPVLEIVDGHYLFPDSKT